MVLKRFRMIAATMLIAGVGLFSAGQAAHAASCQFGAASGFTATVDVWTSTACEDQVGGNDSEGVLNSFGPSGMFGISNWVQNSKFDHDTGIYAPSGLLAVSLVGDDDDHYEGSWNVSSWSGVSAAVLVLKGGNGFTSYLLDMSAGLSGEWSTQALLNGGNQIPGISHVSLYVVAAVPLPAGGLLLIGALGGLGLLRRRRKTA